MFIVNNEITITWVIAPTASPLAESAYDIKFSPSDLDGTYTDAAIINYVAPTAEFAGSIQYKFTPDKAGRYKIYLTTGTAASYVVLDKKNFWVFCAALTTAPSTEVLGLAPIVPVTCP